MLGQILSLITQGLGAAAPIGNLISQIIQNEKNREIVERENQIMREREDNAIQRRAADLKAAGINPLLAGLGQGAQAAAGQIIQATAPQLDLTSLIQAEQLRQSQKQLDINKEKTTAEIGNIKASTEKIKQDMKNDTIRVNLETTDRNIKREELKLNKALYELQKDMNKAQIALIEKEINKLVVDINTGELNYKQAKDLEDSLQKITGLGGQEASTSGKVIKGITETIFTIIKLFKK